MSSNTIVWTFRGSSIFYSFELAVVCTLFPVGCASGGFAAQQNLHQSLPLGPCGLCLCLSTRSETPQRRFLYSRLAQNRLFSQGFSIQCHHVFSYKRVLKSRFPNWPRFFLLKFEFDFSQELSESILAVQYLAALRRAAHKVVESGPKKQKIFLVPAGGCAISGLPTVGCGSTPLVLQATPTESRGTTTACVRAWPSPWPCWARRTSKSWTSTKLHLVKRFSRQNLGGLKMPKKGPQDLDWS